MDTSRVEYRCSRWRALLMFLGSVAFVVLGVWLVVGPVPGLKALLVGIAAVAFFGLCAVVLFMELISPRMGLVLDGDGIHHRSRTRASAFDMPWSELARVRVERMQRQTLVLLDPADPNWGLEGLGGVSLKLRQANIALVGTWTVLSPATFGLSVEALVKEIEARRQV